jgi:undecaprenyl diphosphate synthase
MTLPRHVAIVMDGNGRWARSRGSDRSVGHSEGLKPVRMVIEQCAEQGIAALTLFAFSNENWARPPDEVSGLMELFFNALEQELPELQRNQVRLRFIGDRQVLASELKERMSKAEALTAANSGLELQVALSYGGRQDLLQAARSLAARAARSELAPDAIDEALFSAHLALHGLPDPDLFIRTGGEQRISNFLLWNLAYTELYFCDVLWPDFSPGDFAAALAFYAGRERRYGLTSEQLGAN